MLRINTSLRIVIATVAVGVGLSLWGCGGPQGPTLHPVKGTLKKGGEPLGGVIVTLMPIGGGLPASGITGDDGSFVLTVANAGSGAEAGSYKVILSSAAGADASTITNYDKEPGTGGAEGSAPLFPDEYKSPETSPKTVEVTAGENMIDIDI